MTHSRSISGKFPALKELGVGEFAHLNGTLESHLLATYELLKEWGNPGYICDAGLYHAVYGTQPLKRLGIPHKEYSPSDRPKIRQLIGERAEQLVYFYGACDREYFYPQIGSPDPVFRDRFTGESLILSWESLSGLLEMTLANELEICASGPSFKEAHRNDYVHLFDRFNGLVSVKAYARYRDDFQR